MPFDHTGVAIIIGLTGAGLFATVELLRHKEIEVINSVVVFLALYAVVAGCDLISAALMGKPDNLPPSWREYLCVSGVVGIGLSVQHIIKSVKNLFRKSGNAKEASQKCT